MRMIAWIGAILLTIIVQSTVLPLFAYKGVRPDLLLLMVMSTGLLAGKEQGIGVGFFCGLLQDLASGNIFGLNTLSKMATGYAFGMVEGKVFKEHLFLPLLAGAVAAIVHTVVAFSLLGVWGYKVDMVPALLNQVLPFVLYNVVMAVPVHQIIYRLQKLGNQ